MVKVNWIEIPVLQLERATLFFENVLQIRIQIHQLDNETHGVMNMPGDAGGILIQKEKVEQGISIVFHVDRINEILNKAEQFGGQVLQKKTLLKSYNENNRSTVATTMFDGKTGYFAKIIDSEGNIIGLHSNA